MYLSLISKLNENYGVRMLVRFNKVKNKRIKSNSYLPHVHQEIES